MSIFYQIPPTAGFPLRFKDFFKPFLRKDLYKNITFEKELGNFLSVEYVNIVYSGTVACYLILETLKKLSTRKTVIISGYICPLVALAVKRAGLKIEVCDINKDNFDFDYAQLEEICRNSNDILAIIPVHLAGITCDLGKILELAKNNKIYVVEDAAQSLGAKYKDKYVGTLGDFGFYSFCRGKGLTIYEGGAIVTQNKKYADLVKQTIKELVKDNWLAELIKILELFGYLIFYRPQLFWFVFNLPYNFWKFLNRPIRAASEEYDINFEMHNVSEFRKRVGVESFRYFKRNIEKQRLIAKKYIEGLSDCKGLKIIPQKVTDFLIYPIITLVFDNFLKKDIILKKLNSLGSSQIYQLPINEYQYLKDYIPNKNLVNTRSLSMNHLTLSTSIFLKDNAVDKVIQTIKMVVNND